ncbi:hypothetical protein GCM10027168_09550 [Streptomyces capparidis]
MVVDLPVADRHDVAERAGRDMRLVAPLQVVEGQSAKGEAHAFTQIFARVVGPAMGKPRPHPPYRFGLHETPVDVEHPGYAAHTLPPFKRFFSLSGPSTVLR